MTNHNVNEQRFPVRSFQEIKQKVLNWLRSFDTFCFLDNHQYNLPPHTHECLVAAGVRRMIQAPAGTALDQLQQTISDRSSWLFGHLGYDLKNELEDLHSTGADHIGFPDLYFFEPACVLRLSETTILIEADDPEKIWKDICSQSAETVSAWPDQDIRIQHRLSRREYIDIIQQLRLHILRGDCYEINYCQEFFVHPARQDAFAIYQRLSEVSPNPFSALYRVKDQWLICASPERFLKKDGQQLLSQPIKGTSRRRIDDPVADERSKQQLQASTKDRSENVMIVDLVRNDLARVCEKGSVKVDELYGIYSFPQVHQMISTISGTVDRQASFSSIMRVMFPMGSMTGAPKKRVMELIDRYEPVRRGIFSGALGYIAPNGDFDFNVVIRSIMYNAATGYLSFQAGSGITFYSDPEQEWEECVMKAEAMARVLGGSLS